MLFSYNAYEHDSVSLAEHVVDNLGSLVDLGIAIFSGDICGMVTSSLSIGENAVTPEDEGFGSPFLYVVQESGGEESCFGIREGEPMARVDISASDKKEDMQTVVGAASDAADLACYGMSISTLGDSYNAAKSLVHVGDKATGRFTEGVVQLNRRLMLPVESIKIRLNMIDNKSSFNLSSV